MAAGTPGLRNGSLVRWANGGDAGQGLIGEVIGVLGSGTHVRTRFDDGQELTFVWAADQLERLLFGDATQVVLRSDGRVGMVVGAADAAGLRMYRVMLPGGTIANVLENGLRPAVITDPEALLRAGILHDTWRVNMRIVATQLALAHQFDELSSLSNSRVEIKPHQVGVVHRVMSAYPHRVILADEVGLGKTIEAGLVIKELRARGVASRVLILTPPNLVGQWQYELKTKFNETFSRYTRETVAVLQADHPNENVWTLRDNVITSTTYASWDEARREAITLAGWDLVIVDEAHHVRRQWDGGDRYRATMLYRLVEQLAQQETQRAQAMLLLTATPMQLDPFELYSLVELLDPTLFASKEDFEEHRASLRQLNKTAAAVGRWDEMGQEERVEFLVDASELLGIDVVDEGGNDNELTAGFRELAGRMAQGPEAREEQREELEQRHRLSAVLIRNRKKVVGGFAPRVAVVWPVEMTEQERKAYEATAEYVRTGYARAKAVNSYALGFLMAIFGKLNASSSYALRRSLERRIEKLEMGLGAQAVVGEGVDDEDIEERPTIDALEGLLGTTGRRATREEVAELRRIVGMLNAIDEDTKLRVLKERLGEIAEDDPNAKVLIFTQFRDTQEYIRQRVPAGWDVHLFHGQMKPQEKDESVARFRAGRGPQLLISTEAGGEGRNFQFCHILVNYDLPWNPMKVEQRIGRLDRIGQKHPVKVINFKVEGTIEERVLDVLQRRIRLFEETVGGLDPILGEVEQDLARVYALAEEAREAALEALANSLEERVRAARRAEEQLADLIMDARSFRKMEVEALLQRREKESGPDKDVLRRFVFRALLELGVQVGREDEDPQMRGVYRLRLGGAHSQFATMYPDIVRNGAVRRVTFDPAVAIEHEDVEFLAFGHEIVDKLVERVLKDGYPGLASVRTVTTDEVPPAEGWLFVYTVDCSGMVKRKELVPVFCNRDGEYDPVLSEWLLKRTGVLKKEWFGNERLPERDERFERTVELAEQVAVQRLLERREGVEAENQERVQQERGKLERFFAYKRQAAEKKLEATRATLQKLSERRDEPGIQMILPVWRANVERAQAAVEQLDAERDRRLQQLAAQEHVTAQHGLLTASYVRIVPEVVPGFTPAVN